MYILRTDWHVLKKKISDNNAFHIKHALKTIFHQLQICKQKTTKISPFEAHFGGKPNTPMSVIATKPKLSNLSYKIIVIHKLDEDTVTSDAVLPDDKWLNGYKSGIEVELGMTWDSSGATSSIEGLCRSTGAEDLREACGRTNTKPHQAIQLETQG